MLNVDVGGEKGRDKVKGWLTLDVRGGADYVHDLNSEKPFPFADGEVNNFYCSHTLEHVKPWLVQSVIGEFHRCMRRKYKVRIVVPDMGLAMKWYITNPMALLNKRHPHRPPFYPELPMGWVLSWLFTATGKGRADGHYMGFDWGLLRHYFKAAGFRTVHRLSYGKGSPVFKGKDRIRYKDFSLFVEAKK